MITNTSAPFMTDSVQTDIVKKQRAELYERIYPYAAEDFVTTADFTVYAREMDKYVSSLEAQITRLMKIISVHTHILPPHSEKSPSTTLPPSTGATINWVDIPNPIYMNTTLTTPNLQGNFAKIGTGSEGDIVPELRRGVSLPITLKPTIPPILKPIGAL